MGYLLKRIKLLLRRKRYIEYTFIILNPKPNIAYDDLLGPDLISELEVFPLQESETSNNHTLSVQTENLEVTSDQILSMFKRHNIEATLKK